MSQAGAHHVGYKDAVNLTISLCLTYTLCIACVRIWIRRGAFGVDDGVIAVATVVTFCHTACDYASLGEGLGLSWKLLEGEKDLAALNRATVAGAVIFIVALYLSKCAMLAFLSRITKTKGQVLFYHICNAVMAVLGVVSMLIATVGCPSASGYYWNFDLNRSSCSSQSARWQAITALDLMTEIVILALPVQLIWGLQMPIMRKFMIIMAFFLRLPALGFSIGRNYYTLALDKPTSDAGLNGAVVVIWLEVQLSYALAASTLSALKSFTENFNSGFGQGFTRGKGESSYRLSGMSGSGNSSSNKAPKSADKISHTRSPADPYHRRRIENMHMEIEAQPLPPTTQRGCPPLQFRPETSLHHTAEISAERNGESRWVEPSSAGSENSMTDEMVIVRGQTYEIHHDEAPILPLSHQRA